MSPIEDKPASEQRGARGGMWIKDSTSRFIAALVCSNKCPQQKRDLDQQANEEYVTPASRRSLAR